MTPHEPDTRSDEVAELFETEPVIDAFGATATARIMVVLTDAMGSTLSVSDIAEQADISRRSFYNNLDELLRYDLIEAVDADYGNVRLYRAKMESMATQGFIHLRDGMIEAVSE